MKKMIIVLLIGILLVACSSEVQPETIIQNVVAPDIVIETVIVVVTATPEIQATVGSIKKALSTVVPTETKTPVPTIFWPTPTSTKKPTRQPTQIPIINTPTQMVTLEPQSTTVPLPTRTLVPTLEPRQAQLTKETWCVNEQNDGPIYPYLTGYRVSITSNHPDFEITVIHTPLEGEIRPNSQAGDNIVIYWSNGYWAEFSWRIYYDTNCSA